MKRKKSMDRVLKEQIRLIKPGREHLKNLHKATMDFKESLEKELNKIDIETEIFIGGSFAKGTLVKKDKYDIDIFVRFDWRYDDISAILEKVLVNVCKKIEMRMKKLHGSRDYFIVSNSDKEYYFEVIPVAKIKKVHEEKNVTDLSYFHVPYVRRKIKGLENQLLLAKAFFHAQKAYGAETYIHGFHGYALECLVIYYKSFRKVLEKLSKVKIGERLVIDLAGHYKKKNNVFFEMNENRLQSPIILVDPVYKERNALAALSHETFIRFQKAAKNFLKNPSEKYFVEQEINVEGIRKKAERKKAEFLCIDLKTNKQEGDIAGTKLKKFANLLAEEIAVYFKILDKEFEYDEKKTGKLYLIVKSKKEIVRIGPPLKMKKHVEAFKKEHDETYEKNGFVHTKINIDFMARKFVTNFENEYRKKVREMGIIDLRVL